MPRTEFENGLYESRAPPLGRRFAEHVAYDLHEVVFVGHA
jgi:hypothetical protein